MSEGRLFFELGSVQFLMIETHVPAAQNAKARRARQSCHKHVICGGSRTFVVYEFPLVSWEFKDNSYNPRGWNEAPLPILGFNLVQFG